MLLLIPPELMLHILSVLSFSDLARFRSISRATEAIVRGDEEWLYRHLCFEHGYFNETSSSASGLTLRRCLAPSSTFDPVELERVVAAQRAMCETYDDCQTWRDFGQRPCSSRAYRAADASPNSSAALDTRPELARWGVRVQVALPEFPARPRCVEVQVGPGRAGRCDCNERNPRCAVRPELEPL